MTLTIAIPQMSIIAMSVAAGATIFAFFCVVLYLWSSEPTQPVDDAKLYVIHERMTHLAEPDPSTERRAA